VKQALAEQAGFIHLFVSLGNIHGIESKLDRHIINIRDLLRVRCPAKGRAVLTNLILI
jgi:hypothetical protein